MSISFSTPLQNGWIRMKKALFQPFDLLKWINIGFTAFLAGLVDCNGSGGGNGGGRGGNYNNWDDFFRFPQTAQNWLADHPLWFNLILLGLVLLFIFITVLIWLSSHGKFMFLYNVTNDEAEVSIPWREYKKEGNSLFWWRFFFGWVSFAAMAAFFVFSFLTIKNMYYSDFSVGTNVWLIAGLVLLFLLLIIIIGYISLFLNDFVVPVMYKHRLSSLKGWGKFLSLFGKYPGTFIVYGLFIFVLGITVAIAVLLFAVFTCCIGLLLIAIPFVGSVILLPVSYTFRAFSVEFLGQFGDDFRLFYTDSNQE